VKSVFRFSVSRGTCCHNRSLQGLILCLFSWEKIFWWVAILIFCLLIFMVYLFYFIFLVLIASAVITSNIGWSAID
jgi:hypothetical protein